MPGYTTSYDLDAIKAAAAQYTISKSIDGSDVYNATFALSLDSETAIILRFSTNNGTVPTITIDGTTIRPNEQGVVKDNVKYTLTSSTDSNGTIRYAIRISGISAHKLGNTFTVNGDANGAFSFAVSPLYYVNSTLNKTDISTEAKYCAAALYQYYAAVMAYRNAGH